VKAEAGVVDDPLVHGCRHHGIVAAALAAAASGGEGVHDIARIAGVEPARHRRRPQARHRIDAQGTRGLGLGAAGVIGVQRRRLGRERLQPQRQSQGRRPRLQQGRVAQRHQLRRLGVLGERDAEIGPDAGGLPRGEGDAR